MAIHLADETTLATMTENGKASFDRAEIGAESLESGPSDLSTALQWLNKKHASSAVLDVKPLFWLLNRATWDLDAVRVIEEWVRRLKQWKRQKSDSQQVDPDQFVAEWSDLIEALSMPRSGEWGKRSVIHNVLSCVGATMLLPSILKAGGENELIDLLEPAIAQATQYQLTETQAISQLWAEQMLAVELPLLLVTQFPDFVVADDIAEPAIEWMSGVIDERLDEDGWPSADVLPIFGPLVASWTRSYFMLHKLHWEFDDGVLDQLRGSVRQLLRLLRPDGRLMFTDFDSLPIEKCCRNKLLQLSNHSEDQKIVKARRKKFRGTGKAQLKRLPESGIISSVGNSALLRSAWSHNSAGIGLCFSRNNNFCEIGASTTLVFGNVFPDIQFEGEPVEACGQFEVMCEELDEDVNYVEIQMDLTKGLTLMRQWLLDREEEILFVADSITARKPGRIDYRCRWPLARGISVMPETETQELYLATKAIEALLLPLSLSEWKTGIPLRDVPAGRLNFNSESNAVELTDHIKGSALYVPLVIDLNPIRSRQKRTWRQLTVAEMREPVPRSVAAAFRFQIGNEQWFIYRALASKGMRTFFGEHFSGEFVFGRFKKNGAIKELLRIE